MVLFGDHIEYYLLKRKNLECDITGVYLLKEKFGKNHPPP